MMHTKLLEQLTATMTELDEVKTWLKNDEFLDCDYPRIEELLKNIKTATDGLVTIYCEVPVDGTEGCYPPEDRI